MRQKIYFPQIINFNNYEEADEYLKDLFTSFIKQNNKAVLGLITGSTPINLYQKLVMQYQNKQLDFSNVTCFNLDEYYDLDLKNYTQSYRYFMNQNLYSHINIDLCKTFFPYELNKKAWYFFQHYDQLIKNHNGIDLQILGLGVNGHIGFNEPGSGYNSMTRIVKLSQTTIKANAKYFKTINEVPRNAVTMGIKTILQAKKIILIVYGKAKKPIFEKFRIMQKPNAKIPCSWLLYHKNVTIVTCFK